MSWISTAFLSQVHAGGPLCPASPPAPSSSDISRTSSGPAKEIGRTHTIPADALQASPYDMELGFF